MNAREQSLEAPARALAKDADPNLQRVASWGRLSMESHAIVPLHDRTALHLTLGGSEDRGIAYGNGRSYGDVCLNPGHTLWMTRGLNRFISFDRATGILECEAGVLLKEIIEVSVPHGWFLPVTPGTQFVTLGGAIANDVHGKNHHSFGTMGNHIESLLLQRTDGSLIKCGPEVDQPWFAATVGGLGLTGVIVRARLKLRKVAGPWLNTDSQTFDSLDEFFSLSANSERDWEYTVAWIDCVGGSNLRHRGVLFRGNHASHDASARAPRSLTVPFTPPMSLVNGLSVRLFNALYFRAHQLRSGRRMAHYAPFFYPIDNVLKLNRIYGRRGFYQYQSVVPRAVEREATGELLAEMARSGIGSFLTVLKTFGDRPSAGLLSFPMAGTTLAVDFPNLGERTLRLFERLDAIVRTAGGRVYAAKDARMTRDAFESGYPRLHEFVGFRDPGISSAMSRRLIGS